MNRATILLPFAGLLIATVLAACGGGSEALSANEYRSEVAALCEQPVKDLENDAPTLHSSPAEAEEWAENHRKAASGLRALDGPQAEEEEVRNLARQMDEMAHELDAMAAAIEAGDNDALSQAVGAGVRVRGRVIASCSALEHFGS